MNSLSLLVFLIFSSNSRGNRFTELSPIGEVLDDQYDYFEDGSAPISADYKPLQSNESKLDQAPRRRDFNNWKESDGTLENYNPREGSQEYYDDPSYFTEKYVTETDSKQPQYYQKNYYYNYYPYVSGRRYIGQIGPDRRTEVGGPSRKINPCRQYLEFLRYAFQKLDRNIDYQYDYADYGDDWRDIEMPRNPNAFETRLYGPTLYIDNSGKAYQLNSRKDIYSLDDGIFPISRDTIMINGGTTKQIPTTLFSQEGTSETNVQTDFSSTGSTNWKITEQHSSPSTSTDVILSGRQGSKTISPAPDEQSEQIKDFQKWWKTLKTDSYPTTQTSSYSLEDSSGETQGTFEDYDFHWSSSVPAATTPSSLFNPEDYFTIYGNVEEQTSDSINTSVFYWSSPNTKFEKTTIQTPILPVSPTTNSFSSKTVISLETSEREEKKDDNCNDHMLPCPDTVNITYPLNGYCNRYVSCESGRAIRRTCPDGLHFNVVIKSCDIPHNSFCTYSCPESNGYYGIPGDCSGYFFCKDSMPEYRMCPPRMHWDPQRNICTFAELSRCPMKCVKPNEVKHYEGDCKAYIVCLNGLPFYHKCPPNTKFDSRSLSCIPDRLSKCENDPKLLTKTLNPNLVCKEVDMNVGTKSWCSYFAG